MDTIEKRRLILLYMLFFTYALTTSVVGTFMVDLLNDFQMEVSTGGVFTVFQYIGCMAGVFLSGFILNRYHKKELCLATFGLLTVLLLAMSRIRRLIPFLLLLFLLGMTSKSLDMIVNTTISMQHEEKKGMYINLLHGCFGAGSVLGPLLAAWMLKISLSWQTVYGCFGAGSAALLALFAVFYSDAEEKPVQGRAEKKMDFTVMREPGMYALMLALFCYCGHQCGINTWVPLFLQYRFGVSLFVGSVGTSVFWIALVIGRLACARLALHVKEETLLGVGLILAALLHLAGILVPHIAASMAGYAAAGLFAGAAIPLILTLGYQSCPDRQSSVSVVLFLCISLGQAVFPWVMGLICDAAGLVWGMLSNAACLLGACLFVRLYRSKVKRREIIC